MANVIDYLRWRGDLSFKQVPFNDVDNLLLSQLAYVDLKNFVPSVTSGNKLMLAQVAEDFFEVNCEEDLMTDKSFIWQTPFLMREMAESKRFGEIYLCNFEQKTDEKTQMQFAAFHAKLPDGTTYIAFRGTDDTLIGWKEDFNMSFMSPVPSQLEAVNYVNKTVHTGISKLRFGGHSKGGNLAIYSAVGCAERIKRRILTVYNNDGPGFDKEMVSSAGYRQMLPRIKTIVPKHSVVGMLLEHKEDYIVVESTGAGLMQHDAMTWQVTRDGFVTVPAVSEKSIILNKALNRWIDSMDKDARRVFVDALFEILTESGAKNLSQIYERHFTKPIGALKLYSHLDKESKRVLMELLKALTGEFTDTAHSQGFN